MSGKSTKRSFSLRWAKEDQEHIDACGVGDYEILDFLAPRFL